MARRSKLGQYAKLSATYYRDDAILAAGEAAEVLYTRSLAFCSESTSDGFITDLQLVHVVGVGLKALPRRAKTLVDHGLWERVDGGYVVRQWLKWNPSVEEIGMTLRADRERKRALRLAETAHSSDRNPGGIRSESGTEGSRIPYLETGQDKTGHGQDTPPTPSGPPAPSAARRGTRLPDDFPVTDEMRAWAAVEAPNAGERDHADFCDYWHAKAGRDATKLDWFATWKRWMRRASDERGGFGGSSSAPRGPGPRPGPDQRAADVAELAAHLQAQHDARHQPQIGA